MKYNVIEYTKVPKYISQDPEMVETMVVIHRHLTLEQINLLTSKVALCKSIRERLQEFPMLRSIEKKSERIKVESMMDTIKAEFKNDLDFLDFYKNGYFDDYYDFYEKYRKCEIIPVYGIDSVIE